jgi:hypothetical protein
MIFIVSFQRRQGTWGDIAPSDYRDQPLPARPVRSDLAALYGVPTKVFNQAIQRNAERFPLDFAFQVTREETRSD